MTRGRYEPPRVEGVANDGNALSFARIERSPAIPWTIAGVAANTAPTATPAAPGPSEAELEALREAAAAAGRADAAALLAGELEAMRAEFSELAQRSLDAIADLRPAALEHWRHELATLAVAIAEAVLQRELVGGLPDLEPLLEQALVELDPHERATITVEPALHESVAAWARNRWPAAVVRGDASLRPGDLRVAARTGNIDGTRAARLERARALVLGEDGVG